MQIIGMVHAQALPGAPSFNGDFQATLDAAVADAKALTDGGVDAIIVENFFDSPFPAGPSAPVTLTHLTCIALTIQAHTHLPLGINVLRNDAIGALAVAQAVGAAFVRVNILSGARVTDQGLINGNAYAALRERKRCGAESIGIAADVDVKHSAPLGHRPIEQEARELTERGGADAIIVSGNSTGLETELTDIRLVRVACPDAYLMVGSGVNVENIREYATICDAVIVGSSLKAENRIDAPVDPNRVAQLVAAARGK
jgi:membrane complex biogenesis BtpA family protein